MKEPKYYHGDTCSKYWLCYEGYEWPAMQCPGSELVYSPIVQGCDKKENSVCPGDDYRGHVEKNLFFPELVVHSTCGYRHRNGTYEFYEKSANFMTPELCGYKQSCSTDGMLSIIQCPNGKLWNNNTDVCVPTNEMPICKPSSKWTKQTGVDLEECLGMVDGRCEIGFTDLDRAKKYCEFTDECIGVKQMPCNQISVNMDCVGTFWRPFITFVQSNSENDVYILQRDMTGSDSDNNNHNENKKTQFKFIYADPEVFYYSGCADGLYDKNGNCSMTFETADEGLRHCDKYKVCKGVAKQNDLYIAVENISKDKCEFLKIVAYQCIN